MYAQHIELLRKARVRIENKDNTFVCNAVRHVYFTGELMPYVAEVEDVLQLIRTTIHGDNGSALENWCEANGCVDTYGTVNWVDIRLALIDMLIQQYHNHQGESS